MEILVLLDVQGNIASGSHLKLHLIAIVKHLEDSLDLVIAILSSSRDMEEQIQFGGCQ
jgi:hypothetical protein